ncbi:MAG: alpha/beta hydrolase [Chloroflexota bacterium]
MRISVIFFALLVIFLLSGCFESIDTSHIDTQYIDVPYGTVSETQTLNIYLPNEGEGPFPVIVVTHGGGFMSGSATGGDVADMFEGVNRGYAVASVNYRLSGEATFPAAVNDVRAAVRFLKANADLYDLDRDKMAVWGASAGGNLASMVGTTPNVDALNGDNTENLDYDSSVRAVVDWFGPIEFLAMDEQFERLGIDPALGATDRNRSPESRYIGQRISLDSELTEQANPTAYIDTLDVETAPSFFIQHGTEDANVPLLQSENFAAALTAVLGEDKVTYHVIEGAGHGTEEFSTEENLDLVFEFLDEALGMNR